VLSRTESEYLVRIYEIGESIGPKRMAREMGVSRPTAYEIMRKLKDKGFLDSAGGEYWLTSSGVNEAERILRAHRVIETMFFRAGVELDIACRMAKLLQSEVDEEMVDTLCSFLGNPRFCPHGKPIPGVSR